MIPLKQSTAGQEIPLGPFVDSVDGDTEETPTIANTDIKIWKFGATSQVNKNSGGATHMSDGMFYCVLDATDTNTLGAMRVSVHVSGSLYVWTDCLVMTAEAYETFINTGVFNQLLASHDVASTFGNKINAIGSSSDLVTAMEADGTKLDHLWETTEDDGGVRRFTTNALEQVSKADYALSAAGITAIFNEVVENSKTFIQYLRIIKAATAGKTTDGGTKFRDDADSKDRIVAVVDGSENRTSVTLDGS